ncbi:MAG: AAA family ATPase [Candidatus Obscuribacter sp.]|nr:AAA family ATPase [Candidatus Obscuribacter sp.]
MWVEKVELTSYGGIQGESVIFSQDKVNLVVEPNEYGKTTMATAIWSILFDFPSEEQDAADRLTSKDARRPKPGQPYQAKMDVNTDSRRLTVKRDFQTGAFQVLDRDHLDKDVTAEFLGQNGEDEVGLKLTGMTRELFKSTCFVGQRELDEHAFGGDDMASLVQGIADSASPSGTCAAAIRVLSDSLEENPGDNRSLRIDSLVRDLEVVRQDLLTKLKAFERDRRDVAASFDRLMIINRVVSGDNNRYKATELQNLKYQLTDAQARMTRLREIRQRQKDAASEMEDLPPLPDFPMDLRRPLMDLWDRRKNKEEELEKLKKDLSPHELSFKEKQDEITSRLGSLSSFTQEEAHMVASLAGSMQSAEEELANLTARRDKEREKFTSETGTEDIDAVKESLASLEAEGVDNARSYSSLIVAFQEQLEDAERNLHQSRAKQKELTSKREEERKKRQVSSLLVGFLAVIMIIISIVLLVVVKQFAAAAVGLIVLGTLMLALSGYMMTPVFKPEMLLRSEFSAAEADINRISSDMADKQNKVGALEIKLDALARKVGLNNRAELSVKLEEYGQQSAKIKELSLLDSLVEQKEQVVKRSRLDLKRFLEKASRTDLEPCAASAKELSSSLSQYMEESKLLAEAHQESASAARKLAVVEEEIIDTDKAILNLLMKNGIDFGEDENKALEEARARMNIFASYNKLQNEISAMEAEIGGGFNDLPTFIKNAEDFESRVVQQIDSIKMLYPGIENIAPLTEEELAQEEDAPKDMRELEGLKTEREDLLVRIRSLSNTCDEQYLTAMEDLDLTEFRLQSAKRAKLALELARNTLRRLSGENYIDWSQHLNSIATEMLERLGLGYDEIRFDNELRLVARRKNDGDQISAAQIMSQLSTGTKEQLHWLARMVVARYLSRSLSLPIIMDEPFSEADDERFLKMMRFLIGSIAKEHQVVLFSCHKQRHLWLKQQLDDAEKGNLIFCRRQKAEAR